MMSADLGTAVKVPVGEYEAYSFVFLGRALDKVMLQYVIKENRLDIQHPYTLIDDYEELGKLYKEYLQEMLNIVCECTYDYYKPLSVKEIHSDSCKALSKN